MDSLKSLKGKITVISDIDTIKGENIKRINKINSSFNLDKNSKIYQEISMNVVANILGLGNAATPLRN